MHVLAIDCGTQSLRCIVFDTAGKLLVEEKEVFPPYAAPEPGFAEQEAAVFWEALAGAARRAAASAAARGIAIGGVALAAQRDAVVLLDKEGRVLRPVMIWADRRRTARPRPMAWRHALLYKLAGLSGTVSVLSRDFKGHWLQEHEPRVWEQVDKYLQLSTWLNWKLTGRLADSAASQVGHIPFDYKRRCWEKQHSLKHDVFHIENSKFYSLAEPGTVLGPLSEEAAAACGLPAGIPVVAAGSDKGCETLGTGCSSPDCGALSLGSQASIQTTSPRYFETLRFIPPFPAVLPGRYNPEIQVYRGFWMLSRFLEGLGLPDAEAMEAALLEVPPGSQGLMVHPYWGAGLKMPDARGAVAGFTDVHGKAHIYKAMVEGILFALKDGMLRIEKKSGTGIRRLMVSGGASRSSAICQMAADIAGRPVHRVQTWETTALGASIAGYVGMGVFGSFEEGIRSMVHIRETFLPDRDKAAFYDGLYKKAYRRLYPRLLPIYKQLGRRGTP